VLCNVLWPTREEAVHVPRGNIRLVFCRECGHILNCAFDQSLMQYTQAYENSLHFSPRFQSYAEDLVTRLIERYELHGKDIIDIGCGKGDFLAMICARGDNRGTGFDPSYDPDQMDPEASRRMEIIRDFYSPRYAEYKADLISCRQVLEHIQHPAEFLHNIQKSIGDRKDTAVFFEVPNVLYTVRDLGIWDIIYEHCSYFSGLSLSKLFSLCGFTVCELSDLYEGQFLGIDALPGNQRISHAVKNPVSLAEMSEHVTRFAERYREKVAHWKQAMEDFASSKKRVVVWGSDSKGVTFLNTFSSQKVVEYIVDINPRKQGMYVSGSGQKVVAPEFLMEYKPDIVICMNSIYRNEIEEYLGKLGVRTTVTLA